MLEARRPDRRDRRSRGKTDTIDAENAARLAGRAGETPRRAEGTSEMIRQSKIAGDRREGRSQAIITRKTLIVTARDDLRDAFRDVDHRVASSGAPLIDGVVAYLDCRLEQSYTVGDHEIFTCEVLDLHVEHGVEPRLFHGGQYRFLREAGP